MKTATWEAVSNTRAVETNERGQNYSKEGVWDGNLAELKLSEINIFWCWYYWGAGSEGDSAHTEKIANQVAAATEGTATGMWRSLTGWY